MTAYEERMLRVAQRHGWHTLRTPEEYRAAANLARMGHGSVVRGIGGHDGRFDWRGRRR